MSDHDPLCRRAQITEVFMEGCPECAFIVKVREDQSCKCKFWNGYAAGVRAARDAVAAAYDDPAPMKDGMTLREEIAEMYGRKVMFEDAIDAIDALKEDK